MIRHRLASFGSCVQCSQKINPRANIRTLRTYLFCVWIELLPIVHLLTFGLRVYFSGDSLKLLYSMCCIPSRPYSRVTDSCILSGCVHSYTKQEKSRVIYIIYLDEGSSPSRNNHGTSWCHSYV